MKDVYKSAYAIKNSKKTKNNGKSTVKANTDVKHIVENILSKELESKYNAQVTNYTGFNSIISTFAECYPAMPFIGPSSSPSQTWLRSGDVIQPVSL